MTKADKLRAIIRKDVSMGFARGFEKSLRLHKPYMEKLARHPDFMESAIDELVENQLVFYETVSEDAASAAYSFFMSDFGTEWCTLSAKFVIEINDLMPTWVNRIIHRLSHLE